MGGPMRRRHLRALSSTIAGIAGAGIVIGLFLLFDRDEDITVLALVLLIPIAAASAFGGWQAAIVVAVAAAAGYDLWFLPPIGHVRIGLTRDVATLVTFLAVGIVVAVLAGRQASAGRLLDERRSVLLRSVSHDLRSPLHTIQATATEMLRSTVDDPDTASALRSVVDESRRLDRIVANMLSASRIEAGALLPDLHPEYLPALLTTAIERVRRSSGHPIELIASDALPTVHVDAVQIDQVLANLLDNAVRHSPPGGTVRVTAAATDASFVEVVVVDQGLGFAPALALTAPAPFRRSGSPSGIGLGLVVCSAIIEAHRGDLTIGNAPGGGGRAAFRLPVADITGH